jgi:hypothetical protein
MSNSKVRDISPLTYSKDMFELILKDNDHVENKKVLAKLDKMRSFRIDNLYRDPGRLIFQNISVLVSVEG